MNDDRSKTMLIVLGLIVLVAVAAAAVSDNGKPKPVKPDCPLCVPLHEAPPPAGTVRGVVMDLPPQLRQENWGGGSCVHASTVSVLRWQGQNEMADWWRQQYIGGEYADRLVQRMEAAGLRFAYTMDGDFEFLKWCQRTRRGAGIFYKPAHAINMVGMDSQYVYLLDNNYTDRPEQQGWEAVPINEFVSRWRGYGGFAWTVVYSPTPPEPVASKR